MRVVVVCVGRARGGPFEDDIAHYERLLARHVALEVRELREAGGDARRRKELVKLEGQAILKRLPPSAYTCALDRGGRPLSSVGLARYLEDWRRLGRDVCFVLGGPFGLHASVLERVDARLSFGFITLPHQLARVVLLEQLFRAHKILAGEPYHY